RQKQYPPVRGEKHPICKTLLASVDAPHEQGDTLDHEQPTAALDTKTQWYNIFADMARYTPQETGYRYRDCPYAGDGYGKLPEEFYEGSVQMGLPHLPQPLFHGDFQTGIRF